MTANVLLHTFVTSSRDDISAPILFPTIISFYVVTANGRSHLKTWMLFLFTTTTISMNFAIFLLLQFTTFLYALILKTLLQHYTTH